MTQPWKLWIKPKALAPYRNGELPASILSRIPSGNTIMAYLWADAAYAFGVMFNEAKAAGMVLKSTGKQYRGLKGQEALFYSRMKPTDTGRKPPVTRRYKGKTWWLRKGAAPVATPGTSVHGWGCAVDLDVRQERIYRWLCANGPRFGFYLAGPPEKDGKPNPNFEKWHWQYNTQ